MSQGGLQRFQFEREIRYSDTQHLAHAVAKPTIVEHEFFADLLDQSVGQVYFAWLCHWDWLHRDPMVIYFLSVHLAHAYHSGLGCSKSIHLVYNQHDMFTMIYYIYIYYQTYIMCDNSCYTSCLYSVWYHSRWHCESQVSSRRNHREEGHPRRGEAAFFVAIFRC